MTVTPPPRAVQAGVDSAQVELVRSWGADIRAVQVRGVGWGGLGRGLVAFAEPGCLTFEAIEQLGCMMP